MSLLTTTSESDDDNFIVYECQKAAVEFSNYDNHLQNVLYVVDKITSNAPKEDGFKKATYSYFNDTVYGIAQCRGDVVGEDCSTCLTNAAINMSNNCPNFTKGAMVIRNKCFLMYSNQNFSGQPYGSIAYPYCHTGDFEDSDLRNTAESLFDSLIDELDADETMFDNESDETVNGTVVQAMVECRRDLTADYCKKCLTDAKSNLLNICTEGLVGRYYNASNCNVRYEKV